MKPEQLSIGIFIDGGYYAKINEGLGKQLSMRLDIKNLFLYVREKISSTYSLPLEDIQVTEAHFFRGRYRANDANAKHLLYSERAFEDTLIENDVIFHYKHLREMEKKDGITVVEKGIDVWFALETYELSMIRKFDFVILITGDADHEMLARKLKALKTHVILLTWDPANTASTSRFLKEEVCTHMDMNSIIADDKSLLQTLTL
jgi:uncharacterized LabA/DUF88 family protein